MKNNEIQLVFTNFGALHGQAVALRGRVSGPTMPKHLPRSIPSDA